MLKLPRSHSLFLVYRVKLKTFLSAFLTLAVVTTQLRNLLSSTLQLQYVSIPSFSVGHALIHSATSDKDGRLVNSFLKITVSNDIAVRISFPSFNPANSAVLLTSVILIN